MDYGNACKKMYDDYNVNYFLLIKISFSIYIFVFF